jgi:GT2 family glycosyltransferase
MTTRAILFLCIDFKSEKDTLDLYRDIRAQTVAQNITFSIVCNSGSDDVNKLFSSEARDNLIIEDASDNIGYLPSANRSILAYLSTNPTPDYIVVSNADIRIFDERFFEHLLSGERALSAVVAPKIVTLDGVSQNPFMRSRPALPRILFLELIFRFWPAFWTYSMLKNIKDYLSSLVKRNRDFSIGKERIHAPHGSFMIFPKYFFESGCKLDHKSFLYGEELFVGEICRLNGIEVVYNPDLEVLHKEHAVTSAIGIKKKAGYLAGATSFIRKEFY